LELALQRLDERLVTWAGDTDFFSAVLCQAFGAEATSSDAETLRAILLGEGLGIVLEVRPLPGLLGAYSAATETAAEVVLLDERWLAMASASELEAVLLEEIGHAIDQRLNGALDRPGDEGEIFSSLLRGLTPSPESASENDQRWIAVGSDMRLVEAADPSTVVALNVSSVLLHDGISNRVNGIRDSSQDSLDGSGFVLLTQTDAQLSGVGTPVGLPDDGFFAENAYHPNIQLSYRNSDNGVNARILSSDAQFFDLSAINLNISELHFAALSTDGSGQLKVTYTYTDGTTGSGQFIVPDWYNEITQTAMQYYLIDGMDRVNLSGTYYNDNDPAVFGFRLLPDSKKTVQSIRFQKVGATAKVVFLGATVIKASPAVALTGSLNPVFAASSIGFGLGSVGTFASPSLVDMDGDGDLDAYIGGFNGNTLYFRNTGTATSPGFAASSIVGLTNLGGYANPALADIDNDGDLDALVGNGDGLLFFFRNNGLSTGASFAANSIGFGLPDVGALADPCFADIDGDGDLDLFVGNSDGSVLFFRNTGTLTNPLFSGSSIGFGLPDVGSNAAPSLADIDGDGDLDAFIGNSTGNILFFRNTGSASSPAFAGSSIGFSLPGVGTFANPTFADIDSDGDLDAFVGNSSGNTLFFRNIGTEGLRSITANGSYGVNSLITIQVPFTETVTVNTASGTPTLLLETGSTDRTATYSGGSGTNTLSFQYTVQAGDASVDLDANSASALQLNGATIRDAAGNNAILTLPSPGATGSLAANAALVVDGVAPVVADSGLSSTTANGTYGPGSVITIQVPFSETVTVNTAGGTPTLLLETGSTDRTATYSGGSGTNTLSFQYTVQAGDASVDLDANSASALQLNGATIRDAAGNNAILTLPSPGSTGSLAANAALVVDGVAPTISGSTPADDATDVHELANLQLSFSENVSAGSGWIQLHRADGTLLESFDAASGTGSAGGSVAFSGTTVTLNPFADLTSSTGYYLTTASTAIRDAAGNAFAGISEPTTLNFSTGDSIAPAVSGISSSTGNGTYGAGAVISLTIRFSEAVTVTFSGGVPSLLLETGATDRPASYVSGSGSNTLSFAYTVQSGDSAADLDVTSSTALLVNGGSIRDAAGNNATLTLPAPGGAGSLGANADLVINGTTIQSLILTTSTPRVHEGSTLSAMLSSSTLAPGSTLHWSLSGPGITAADFTIPDLTGSISLGGDRRASFSRMTALDGVSEPDEEVTLTVFSDPERTLSLGAIQFTLRDLTATGVSGATDDRDLIIGTSGDETISGVPAGSLLNGRGSFDTLTGNGGNDTFVLCSANSVFYNDGQAAVSGTSDLAAITDFNAGDRLQLKGAASEYRLSNATLSGVSGTLLFWRASAGGGSVDEAIGFLQGVSSTSLSLSNSNQFLYV
jgi:hypothetical protein